MSRLFVGVLLLGAVVTSVQADDPPQFILKWGSLGSGEGDFNSPRGIAVATNGTVYVVDTNNNRIQQFDGTGTFLTSWGSLCDLSTGNGCIGDGSGQFYLPWGIAISRSNHVYVVDTWNNRIQKFASDGTFLHMWGVAGTGPGELDIPRGTAIDLAENIYVADYGNHRIQKFDGNGIFLATWGSHGSGDGQFIGPIGIAIGPDGNLYVTDTFNSRIQVFDGNGNFLLKWGSFGSADGQFQGPWGISADANGNVYVADFFNRRIQKLDGGGTFLTKWGAFGSGDGEFNQPFDVAVDFINDVYVSDSGNNRIQKFGLIPTDLAANDRGPSVTLHAPWPNPMRARTHIAFSLGRRSRVGLRIYDVRGRLIRTLVDDVQGSGSHIVSWDGLDDRGAPVPTSTYFMQLNDGALVRTRKVTVMD